MLAERAAGRNIISLAVKNSDPHDGDYNQFASRESIAPPTLSTIIISEKLSFVQVDHLNTPRAVYDSAQQLRWRWDQQEPFGDNPADENPINLGAFDLPLRLPGQVRDAETGLHYNYYRDYDPSLGIYKQSDPIGLVGGLNTYAYVGSSPLLKTDVEGLQSSGGVSPQQNYFYQKCLDEELKYCTIGTGAICGILCAGAATTGGGVPAAIVVAGLCFPSVNYLCAENKKKYCAAKWIK